MTGAMSWAPQRTGASAKMRGAAHVQIRNRFNNAFIEYMSLLRDPRFQALLREIGLPL